MAERLPPELCFLAESSPADREAGWAKFIATHTRLLLQVARSIGKGHDDAMDAYTTMLSRLVENDYRRLRAYAVDPRSKFTTWLVVVARRLCLDWYRTRYGRDRSKEERLESTQSRSRALRRRLADLSGEELTGTASTNTDAGLDDQLVASELSDTLATVLAQLDPSDRLLIKLRFEYGMPALEIAAIMRLSSPFHVYRRINQLLAQMRRALQERGVEGPVP